MQFDVGSRVGLTAFVTGPAYHHDPATLREAWLDAEVYYGVLRRWRNAFEAEPAAAEKTPEGHAVRPPAGPS